MESINHNWKTIYYHLRYEYEDSLSHQAVRILQIISRKKAATIGNVASELNLSHNTASEHIKRLIQKGFILKERNKQDERVVNVTLTVAGRNTLAKHTLLDEEKLTILQSRLSKEEKHLIETAFSLLAKEAKHVFSR
ncbi:MarR family transcriptional regulator [Bacillus sp. DX1.1]|uniref:MarR family winged helix-turn-helix transcriptional regulator n=1 Tax=unclassified Bacillus (in: firmicutes) TaxID=185979 RepID=UPI0025706B3C|nr:MULTISPECIES: MarR family transcriptional regulator [unclassified Bacillus (in: firmicutes)]MDM5154278.1 MarR family transcriptional regulator [Bacillus sp. DX1.1]WJE83195.1 MarR family transcriptional regulator [Bacillus sp. DX3.1]